MKLYPNEYHDSIYEVDFNALQRQDIRGLILDLDNTIMERDRVDASAELRDWLDSVLKRGFQVCILSNNWKGRVGAVGEQLNLPVIAGAGKPRKKAFRQALDIIGVNPSETAIIGDQIFTDILGGNSVGLYTILVMPISDREAPHTKVLRFFERLVLRRFAARPDSDSDGASLGAKKCPRE